jgi:hypothetical protein
VAYTGGFLTLFPSYQDESGRKDFQLMHYLRHKMYAQAAARAGVALYTPDLTANIDADWFQQHWQAHVALDRIQRTGLGNTIAAIDVSEWQAEGDYNDWHNTNAFLHSRIEQALGLT